MAETKIEWAHKVWNPITGCSPVSTGCENCYAAKFARRLAGRAGYDKNTPFAVTFHADRLDQPRHWQKRCRIFTLSMGDMFHPGVRDEWRRKIFAEIAELRRHRFLVLTKRPHIMHDYLRDFFIAIPRNLWLGVSVEDQATAQTRIPILAMVDHPHTFVSYEPALGDVNWDILDKSGVKWLIAGGETGPGARAIPKGGLSGAAYCAELKRIPFFWKSLGTNRKNRRQDSQFANNTPCRDACLSPTRRELPPELQIRLEDSYSLEGRDGG